MTDERKRGTMQSERDEVLLDGHGTPTTEECIWEDGHRAGIRFERKNAQRKSAGSFWAGFAFGLLTGLLCLLVGVAIGAASL